MAIDLTIVTPEGEAFRGSVDQVVLPGSEGEFGVLERHERYLAPLQPGLVRIDHDGSTHWAAVSDGFADVSADQVVVLVERCRRAEEIDLAATQAEIAEIESELKDLSGSDPDQSRASQLEAKRAVLSAEREAAEKG